MSADWINWEALTKLVHEKHAAADLSDLHGPNHWHRVCAFAQHFANQSGGDVEVARLFGLLHDSCRESDCYDPDHGPRAAQYAETLQGKVFQIEQSRLDRLIKACWYHTDGDTYDYDPCVGSCLDGDRCDISRVGAVPHEKFMSTDAAKQICSKQDWAKLKAIAGDGYVVPYRP